MAKKSILAGHVITIAGSQFTVPVRYAEGHVVTAGEAGALNQTYWESVRNNLASKVKEGKVSQDDVDAYAEAFQFGAKGGFVANPIESMALAIARRKINKKGLSASEVTAAAHALLAGDKGAAIRKAAAVMVEA